jgi:hypothetical protein
MRGAQDREWLGYDAALRLVVLGAVAVLVAVLGFVDFLTHNAASQALHLGSTFQATRTLPNAVYSVFPHPNPFSLFMSMLFSICLYTVRDKRSKAELVLAVLFAMSVLLPLRLRASHLSLLW